MFNTDILTFFLCRLSYPAAERPIPQHHGINPQVGFPSSSQPITSAPGGYRTTEPQSVNGSVNRGSQLSQSLKSNVVLWDRSHQGLPPAQGPPASKFGAGLSQGLSISQPSSVPSSSGALASLAIPHPIVSFMGRPGDKLSSSGDLPSPPAFCHFLNHIFPIQTMALSS